MIEQLKPFGQRLEPPIADDSMNLTKKRVSITEELLALADKQEALETERGHLKDSVRTATDLLIPLRAQMQEVVACMKRFHEMENEYVALSQQTYRDIAFDMNAIGKEIEQTKGLLQEGTRLAESGLEVTSTRAKSQAEADNKKSEEAVKPEVATDNSSAAARAIAKASPQAAEPAPETHDPAASSFEDEKEAPAVPEMSFTPDVEKFWDAVNEACKQAKVVFGEDENTIRILLSKEAAMNHPDLTDVVQVNIADGDALSITMHERMDDTVSLEAELTTADGRFPMPLGQAARQLGIADRERLVDCLDACEVREMQKQNVSNMQESEQEASNFDGLLEELGVE